MFCTNCGREIIDTARFCNFCGAPIQNAAADVPVEPVQPSPDPTESASIPVTEGFSENVPGEITETAESAAETETAAEASVENTVESGAETGFDSAIPTPNAIPTYGTSEPLYSEPPAYPAPAQSLNTIPVQSAVLNPENKPERKYTLGHIMMCLAAVAVMAIVAGVFAGLYFSVV